MIEAVNSVLSNAQVARGNAEQNSQARSLAANPERVQEVAQAPYVSPYIFLDVNYDRAVLQLRDSDTGDVLRQYPSESQMEAYRRAQSTSDSTPVVTTTETDQGGQTATPSPTTSEAAPAAPQPEAPAPDAAPVTTDA